MRRLFSLMLFAFAVAGSASGGQSPTVAASEVTPFIGTWVFTMIEPWGTHETVRIWDKNGTVAASVQAEQFPPIDAS